MKELPPQAVRRSWSRPCQGESRVKLTLGLWLLKKWLNMLWRSIPCATGQAPRAEQPRPENPLERWLDRVCLQCPPCQPWAFKFLATILHKGWWLIYQVFVRVFKLEWFEQVSMKKCLNIGFHTCNVCRFPMLEGQVSHKISNKSTFRLG